MITKGDLTVVFVGLTVVLCILFLSTWLQDDKAVKEIVSTCKEVEK